MSFTTTPVEEAAAIEPPARARLSGAAQPAAQIGYRSSHFSMVRWGTVTSTKGWPTAR